MRVAVPVEKQSGELRVAITPAGVQALVAKGHKIVIESNAGAGAGIGDDAYEAVGAEITDDVEKLWGQAELVCKVKPPVEEEFGLLRRDQVVFGYLNLAGLPDLARAFLDSGAVGIGYAAVRTDDGTLPLLSPMSEIAGRMAVQVGAEHLMRSRGGAGVLLGGGSGVRAGRVVVIGGGVAGFSAARVAAGMGAEVTVFDINPARMRQIDELTGGRIRTAYSTELDLAAACIDADLVIGALLVPGDRTPHLVSSSTVERMRPGSVLVDIAIDQGGCFEDSSPTTHEDPTFEAHGSLFCCIDNLPGAVPVTATHALTNASMRYMTLLADKGWQEACRFSSEVARGVLAARGRIVDEGTAKALGEDVVELSELLD